jgi:hypothetical protein
VLEKIEMSKSKKPPETVSGAFAAVPLGVMDSQAFIGATDRAKSLLYALLRQINGSNNGRLQLTDKWLREHGWPSAGLNCKARDELIERELIIQTRRGGLNFGCDWFAVTWLSISNFVGLDVSAQTYHKGSWAGCSLPPTPRRKPPKRATPSDHGSSATPTTGAVNCLATPTTGAKKALFGTSTTPTSGNNVSIPIHPGKSKRGMKRIVGKAGRSGIAKEFRKSEVVASVKQ